jgi:hypothetical protein
MRGYFPTCFRLLPGARGDGPRRQRHGAPRRSRTAGIRQYDASFPELKQRLDQAGADRRQRGKAIKITFASGATRDFADQSLLLNNALPNFYFHCTTAYDILRQCGMELGKRNFMGTPVSL